MRVQALPAGAAGRHARRPETHASYKDGGGARRRGRARGSALRRPTPTLTCRAPARADRGGGGRAAGRGARPARGQAAGGAAQGRRRQGARGGRARRGPGRGGGDGGGLRGAVRALAAASGPLVCEAQLGARQLSTTWRTPARRPPDAPGGAHTARRCPCSAPSTPRAMWQAGGAGV